MTHSPKVSVYGHVDLDYSRPLRVKGRRPMYALPLRGPNASADEFVISIDQKSVHLNASGGSASGASSIALFIFVMGMVAAGSIISMGAQSYMAGDSNAAFILKFTIGLSIAPFLFGVAALIWTMRADAACPLIVNRLNKVVLQNMNGKLTKANWSTLEPYVEPVRVINAGGAYTTFNLHLIELTDSGSYSVRQVLVKGVLNSPHEALRYYEFLRRYIDAEWSSLPETYMVAGYRLPLWKEFRSNMWNSWMNRTPWTKRTARSQRLLLFTVPLWTSLWWPMIALALIGSRFGRVPKFPKQELTATNYNIEEDGPVPVELLNKIHPEPPLELAERRVYLLSFLFGGILWAIFGGVLLSS